MTNFSKMIIDAYTNPAQLIQQQADEAKLPLNDYLDLYPEAGWEFEKITFDEARDEYAQIVATEEAGSEEAPMASDKFIATFAKFIINLAAQKNAEFLAVVRKHAPNVTVYDYTVPLSQDYPITLCVKNGNIFYLQCTHEELNDGFEGSPYLEAWYVQHFADCCNSSTTQNNPTLSKDILDYFAEILSRIQA